MGVRYRARAVILTTGTFLRGAIFVGEARAAGGRAGEAPAIGLSHSLDELGFPLARLKTGTPCRLDRKTIDIAGLELQPGDDPPPMFRWTRTPRRRRCRSCRAGSRTRTSARTRSSATACRARRCTARRSRAPGRATARASRTRSSGSRTRTATRSTSSPRASTRRRSIRTGSRRRCRSTSSSRSCARSPGSSAPR